MTRAVVSLMTLFCGIIVLSVTEGWFDALRRTNQTNSWKWDVIGFARIVLLFGSIPVIVWIGEQL